jgi:HAE1 family hydrophobic/amphiphilic exporter-1
VQLPSTYSFEDAKGYFARVEKVLEENQERWDLDGYFFFHRSLGGQIQGWFNNPRTNELTPRQITDQILETLPETPGVLLFAGQERENEKKGVATHMVTLNGEDPQVLEEVEDDLEVLFAHVDGVVGLKKSGQDTPNELGLVIDRDRAQRQQINPGVIAGVVGYALRGQALPKYYSEGREIPVRVRFQKEDRESLAELADFAVPTGQGSFVSLASVTRVEHLSSPRLIRRLDKRLARTITLELEEGREDETRKRLRALAARIDLPEGVSFGSGQRPEDMDEDAKSMLFAASLSIVFIYLLMGFLFESFVLPLSILLTIPLAGIGVVWMHLLAGRNIDFLGTVGLVLLIGVVVNNGIVLIDYVNRLRQEGLERTEALLRASSRRFRPIMMTALTTIFGMIPLAMGGTNSIGLSYTSFGYTLIGGLASATLLTLLVVPVFYTLFDDARSSLEGVLRLVLRRKAGSAGAPSVPAP